MKIIRKIQVSLAACLLLSLVACCPKVETGNDMDNQLRNTSLQTEPQYGGDVARKIEKSGVGARNMGVALVF